MEKASDTKSLNDPKVRRIVTNTPAPAAPSPRAQVDKVRVIKRSLLCYNICWLGLIPLLGIAPALIVLRLHFSIQRELGGEWNPARKYDIFGMTVALWGFAISAVLWIFILFNVWREL